MAAQKNSYSSAILGLLFASTQLEDIISDECALAVALFLSPPEEINRIADKYDEDDDIYELACTAVELHRDEAYLQENVELGVFSDGISTLLQMATEDELAALRLVPLLLAACYWKDKIRLSPECIAEIERVSSEHLQRIGYQLYKSDDGLWNLEPLDEQ